MYKINDWNENEKHYSQVIAQDVLNTSKPNPIETICCIDTTKTTISPCSSAIKTSCCIDTSKE